MDFRMPAHVLLAGAAVAAALTPISLWWALPTAVCAFQAGSRPGRTRGTALALVAVVVAAVAVVAVVPAPAIASLPPSPTISPIRSISVTWSGGRPPPGSTYDCRPTDRRRTTSLGPWNGPCAGSCRRR